MCDHATELVKEAVRTYSNIAVLYIDIVEDDELMAAYGLSIPVLAVKDNARLLWPFTVEDIKIFIESAQ